MPNKDEIKGKFKQVTGRVKEGVGRATGDPALELEGIDDQAAGEVQQGIGTAKRNVGKVIEKVGKAIKK